jgi:outer membrane protein insertion porin family
VAAALVPLAAHVARAEEGDVVASIEFRGNQRYSNDTLRLSLRTKVGQKLDRALLPEDVNTLLQYFESVDLKEERSPEGVKLVFTVLESPPVVSVDVAGVEGLSKDEVRRAIETTTGRPVAEFRIANDQRRIEKLYRTKGYHFVQVTPRTTETATGRQIVFEILEGPQVEVDEIEFTGNRAFPKDKLLERVATQETKLLGLSPGYYVEETVRQDLLTIRNFYRNEGWLNAQVELEDVAPSPDRSEVKITIRVIEGEAYMVGTVGIEGASSYPGGVEALRALVTTKTGDRKRAEAVYRSVDAIERAYRDEGFYAVVVTPEEKLRPDSPVADLVYRVEESSKVRVRNLIIAGNVVTQDKVLRREIPLAPGEVLNQNAIDKGVRKLRGLGYFERVSARIEPPGDGDDPNLRDVTIEVDDTAPTGSVRFGVGVSSDTGLNATVDLTKRNFDWKDWPERAGDVFGGRAFSGGGQTFQLELSPGSDYSRYRISFTEPWLFDKPISFGWDLFINQFRRFDYDQDAKGIDFFLGRRWTFEGRERDRVFGVQGRTRIESFDVDNLDEESTPTAYLAEGSNSLVSEELTFRLSQLDSDASPTDGWYGQLATEFGFAGDVRLWKNSLEAKRYFLLARNEDERPHVLSVGAKLALAQPLGSSVEADPNLFDEDFVPIYESYFAGGSTTVRGFAYGGAGPHGQGDPFLSRRSGETPNERLRRLGNVARSVLENDGDPMGGQLQFVTSAEYTFPMYEDVLRGVLFLDAGMVRHSFSSSHGLEEDDVLAIQRDLLGSTSTGLQQIGTALEFDDGDSFFSDVRVAVGFGVRIRIPALGPVPLALDIGIPVREQDGDDTQIISFSISRVF